MDSLYHGAEGDWFIGEELIRNEEEGPTSKHRGFR